MKRFLNKTDLSHHLDALRAKECRIGFVPTMGALHAGHVSLVEKGLSENEVVVVSIFVNPTQFDNPEDLEKYPRSVATDIELLQAVDPERIVVYTPSEADVYGDDVVSEPFDFGGLEHEMEGAFRAGHFDGVGTIVKRLFEIVEPRRAYFGEKDFQQLQIIKKMVANHKLPVEVMGCPIYREEDGLAMSSRNARLTEAYRAAAPFIYETIKTAKVKFGTERAELVTEWVNLQFKNHTLLELEYFVIADTTTLKPVEKKSLENTYRAFIAVYAGDIRLIDNIALN
ncbi:pantoate--beta-alanine ligase [Winogradskyella rapida]|uniref:Pantothenate synthetase n=1 Tax=Winogradskyella rapida TaxID=549701 RepID=A0ABW3KSK4_9FLAO